MTKGRTNRPARRRRPRVPGTTLRERRELDPGVYCPDCDGDLRVVGEDISELPDMITAQMKAAQIARIKKSCRRWERMVQVVRVGNEDPKAADQTNRG